jgi:PIN domain nuclease of toxin-antitoxin system
VRLLLDTHAFLWWRLDAPELGAAAKEAIANDANEVFVSSAVAWEIVIKRALGRLEFAGSVDRAVGQEGFSHLAITLAHADEVAALPDLHRDPFDRMLVAQARVESLTLVTRDPSIRAYEGFGVLNA